MDKWEIFIYISEIPMWYDVSRAASAQPAASLSLQVLYQVRADLSYDVFYNSSRQKFFIALRTLKGTGILDTTDGETIRLTQGTLLILLISKIKRYRAAEKLWHFWWFEFSPLANWSMPDPQVFEPGVLKSEISGLNACFSDLRRNGPAFQARASARFTLLMHDWIARCPDEEPSQKHHRAAIQRVVNLMHTRLETPLDVPALAQAAGLGERRFRQVFSLLTGKSPKCFYEELRLRKAADHLRFGAGNVSETADKFGYSSPFHFSKAFRNFFGVSPSHYLTTLSNATPSIRG